MKHFLVAFFRVSALTSVLLFQLYTTFPAFAADGKLGVDPEKCNFTSGSGLLDLEGSVFKVADADTCSGLLADYMVAMINFFFRLAITLAVLMIAIGGFQWLMAIGNSSKISNAKDTIQQAVVGLILAMTATLLFSQIDTSFTEFKRDQFDIQLGAGDYTFCQSIEPITFYFQAMAETGEDQVNPKVIAEATKIAEKECGKQSGRCTWIGGECKSVLGGELTAAQCENKQALAIANNVPFPAKNSTQIDALISCVTSSSVGPLIDTSQLYTYELTNDACNYTRGQPVCGDCAHAVQSCHYGGANLMDGSHAVDFNAKDGTYIGEGKLFYALETLQGTCNFGFMQFEDDHTHVSTDACSGSGD